MQKNSLFFSSSGITRYFWLFIFLLFIALGSYGYNYTNAYLTEKKYALISIANNLQQRIEDYRYHTHQIYELANTPDSILLKQQSIQETRLRPDIYYLEKARKKTDALIFKNHEPGTLNMTVRISNYLDRIWGSKNDTFSMYYLNGQDNSLILITTQPLTEITSRFKESYLNDSAESRRAEMLLQANTLDERESFSALRKLRFQNAYYFTLRTTFNRPGHLATVIAFDLPINDLIPVNMARSHFLLQHDASPLNENGVASEEITTTKININGSWLEFSTLLTNASLKIVYRVPIANLALDLLRNNIWLLLINFLLIGLATLGIYSVRQQFIRPNADMARQLTAQHTLNQEIITNLPLGLLIYNFTTNTILASNKIAEYLLPHLNLQKMMYMAEQHHGVIQATVNNEVYEIRILRSEFSPETYLFLLHNQDKEMQIKKKLQLARLEYDKNLQARKLMLHNLGIELNQPISLLNQVARQLQQTNNTRQQQQLISQLINQSESILTLIDNIVLLTCLETQDWYQEQQVFSLALLIDEVLLKVLPAINQKNLSLFKNYLSDSRQQYIGDEKALHKILFMLLQYAITTTAYGKITINVSHESGYPEQLVIQIADTGKGISNEEISNLDYPFLSPTLADRYHQGSGLTFFLCNQLCKKLNGQLTICSKIGIGTRYTIRVTITAQPATKEEQEQLLDGIVLLLDITSEEVRSIVTRSLNTYGASCIIADDRLTERDYDVLLTDNPQHYDAYTVLLASDELGFQQLQNNYIRANYNISSALINSITLLIEKKISSEESNNKAENIDEDTLYVKQLKTSDYYELFVETVPVDLKKLYNEAQQHNWVALSQTTHRLKGVFAMLNLVLGKQLCEILEQHIANNNQLKIEDSISRIDSFVSRLLQQGNLQHE